MEAHKSFERFDHSRKGFLDKQEFSCALRACFGFDFSVEDIDTLFLNGQNSVSQPELRDIHCYTFEERIVTGIDLPTFLDIVKRRSSILANFDESYRKFTAISRHNKGFLTVQDIRDVFLEIGQPHAIADDLFNVLDSDRDQRVSFSDFKRFTTTSYEDLQSVYTTAPPAKGLNSNVITNNNFEGFRRDGITSLRAQPKRLSVIEKTLRDG